jgi:hypothetical protein
MGQPERATRLFSASQALRESISAPLPPFISAIQQRTVASARDQTDKSEFAKAWAEGRAMSMEQAIEYALH